MSKDDEISRAYRNEMNALAHALDETFNGGKKGKDRTVCFVLLVAGFDGTVAGEDGRVNYISNGERADTVNMMKELIARFEEQAEDAEISRAYRGMKDAGQQKG